MAAGIPKERIRASLTDEVYRHLKQLILIGELPPGTEFTELQAAEIVGSSRTPVREALARLRHGRLIVLLAARRYAVAPILLSDVKHLFAVRKLIETETTRLATGRVDASQLREFDRVCATSYNPADPGSVQSFLGANKEFHLMLAQAGGNPRLVDLLVPLLDEMDRLLYLGLRHSDRGDEILHEHRALIAALEIGDPEAAASETERQLRDAQDMVTRAFLDGAFDATVSTSYSLKGTAT